MATRITFHQIPMCLSRGKEEDTVVLPGVAPDRVFVVGNTITGGGSNQPFLLDVVVLEECAEPPQEPQAEDAHAA